MCFGDSMSELQSRKMVILKVQVTSVITYFNNKAVVEQVR